MLILKYADLRQPIAGDRRPTNHTRVDSDNRRRVALPVRWNFLSRLGP
jgi:hypothetical protein